MTTANEMNTVIVLTITGWVGFIAASFIAALALRSARECLNGWKRANKLSGELIAQLFGSQ